ncbi:MAG: tRNA (adenine-N1)-methyltransferase [Sulfolobales archaeon]|nr:tRNA (adenine-N1)-methyltransferase [Sulfolobales archaeon]MCX8198417.1 tRNA (adenine-N1)-methyltransferase [Sulfolobales archaeon]MDW8169491.1 tRNA (adenine-N1)-methyltransferase [Desulfurococcaceae archaeon]
MSEVVSEGSIVLLVIDRKRRFLTRVEKGGVLGTDKGYINHEDLIGLEYGSIVKTSQGHRAIVLKPMHYDYIHGYRRVTQVIYPKDAGYMIYMSGIGPGSIVVEGGVGTGYLTTCLARAVGENGAVYGYEVREDFLKAAMENLAIAGLLSRVKLKLKDVRDSIDEEGVDAVFLDIPDPWNAIESSYKALKPSHLLLAYIPTVNQVEKTVLALRRHGGYCDVRAVEIMLREMSIEEGATRPAQISVTHTGYIVYARKTLRQQFK